MWSANLLPCYLMLFRIFSSSSISSTDFDLLSISSILGVFMKDDQNLFKFFYPKGDNIYIYDL